MSVEEYLAWSAPLFQAFTDLTFAPAVESWSDSVVVDGNLAVSRQTISMTFDNPVADFEPNGNLISVNGINLWRFEDGKIAEVWLLYDTMGEIEQMMAPPEEAGV